MTTHTEARTAQQISLCTVHIGAARYGIETSEIQEVLGGVCAGPVPLARSFVAGIASYRGDVLTVLDLGALLGFGERSAGATVLVFLDQKQGEVYGIGVDAVEGVACFDSARWQPNPSTLPPAAQSLFHGSYRDARGPIVRLDPGQLAPTRLITYPWLRNPAAQAVEPQ